MLKIPRVPFGLDALGEIKFLISLRIFKARVSSSGEKTGLQNYIVVIGIAPIWGGTAFTKCTYQEVIPTPGECTRFQKVNTNPSPIGKRVNIKLILKLKKSITETFQILTEACVEQTLHCAFVFEWHKQLSGGRDSAEDNEHAGRPNETILVNLDRKDVRRILTDELYMKKVCASPPSGIVVSDDDCCAVPFRILEKGTHFNSIEEVQAKTENLLKRLLKTSFRDCYHQWQYQMHRCGNAKEDYFEGNTVMEN
ncbi:HTH_48 domain-containing protein [Trichonephila clavipes]|nr:HTH_48 domain-containing protein [Trichonephila clavipes]